MFDGLARLLYSGLNIQDVSRQSSKGFTWTEDIDADVTQRLLK